MKATFGGICSLVLSVLVLSSASPLRAQAPDPDPSRFADAIEEFADWDAKNTPPADAIVFVGSSSIRFWDTAEWFPDKTVINRGFGGSHSSDVNHFLQETVLKYDPAVVVFYAGDNDLAADKTPRQVAEDVRAFASTVLEHGSDTEVVIVSIKPSLSRWSIWPQMIEANELIQRFAQSDRRLHFVDVGTPMLGRDGEPIPALFVQDGLHMTEAGYEIWTEEIGSVLDAVVD